MSEIEKKKAPPPDPRVEQGMAALLFSTFIVVFFLLALAFLSNPIRLESSDTFSVVHSLSLAVYTASDVWKIGLAVLMGGVSLFALVRRVFVGWIIGVCLQNLFLIYFVLFLITMRADSKLTRVQTLLYQDHLYMLIHREDVPFSSSGSVYSSDLVVVCDSWGVACRTFNTYHVQWSLRADIKADEGPLFIDEADHDLKLDVGDEVHFIAGQVGD